MFQHLQMLGHRRPAHREGLGDLADARLAQRQPRQDRAAGGVGQGGEGVAERVHVSNSSVI